MKITRYSFHDEKKTERIVLTEKGTQKYWKSLMEKCRNKCDYYSYGMPKMVVRKNEISLRTRNGDHFKFKKAKQ